LIHVVDSREGAHTHAIDLQPIDFGTLDFNRHT
jgi:hypothetical protein